MNGILMRVSKLKSIRDRFRRVRSFDYADLSFLYIACLLTIALVYTVFRVSQYYFTKEESRVLEAIQLIGKQREQVLEFERFIAFAQNRTTPQYPMNARLLIESYSKLIETHAKLGPRMRMLQPYCKDRRCAMVYRKEFVTLPTIDVAIQLSGNSLSLREHNLLLQQLFDLAVDYRMALSDSLALSFDVIHKKKEAAVTFDIITYFSLMVLLLIQAVYIFRPAIRHLNASLSTRSDFLSQISHEIRNPMNSIIGMADILRGTKLNYEQEQYVDNLIRSGHALLDMLNGLIDSSALEVGKLQLKIEPFDLFRTIDRSLHLVSLQAHHKNLNLYLRMKPEISCRLMGDSVRLEQVMINLVNNAVKFTEQGHVTLDIDLVDSSNDSLTLNFSVEDTGIGIPQNQLGEIFKSFVQADSSIKRKYGGSGLGLTIASELIRMMGGELLVQSEVGKGTKFYFTLTLDKQANADTLASSPLKTLCAHRFIFMVSTAEAPAYQKSFANLSAPATLLNSSQELRTYLSTGDHRDVHQLMIDDSMGIISMITCRNVADEKGLGGRTVALIRSNFTKENMDLLKRNGFTRFLVKPLKPWELLALPAEMHEDGTRMVTGGADVVKKLREKNLRVLLVDDSNDNLFLMREVMSPLASSIHFAENGLEAIEKFSVNSYDAVLMDIQMPVMDGYTAIRKMREIEKTLGRSVPIYAVTAHAGLVDAQKCREAGFTDRIVKPVVRSDIYKSLSKAFALEEGDDFAIDQDQGIPAKYLNKLMPTFLKSRREDIERLRKALDQFDFETVGQLGHKMKGSSASYGFPDATNLSHDLEIAARKSDLEACTRIAADLERAFERSPPISEV